MRQVFYINQSDFSLLWHSLNVDGVVQNNLASQEVDQDYFNSRSFLSLINANPLREGNRDLAFLLSLVEGDIVQGVPADEWAQEQTKSSQIHREDRQGVVEQQSVEKRYFKNGRNAGQSAGVSEPEGAFPSDQWLSLHEEYFFKRVKEALPRRLTFFELFEEIIDRGYEGNMMDAQAFVLKILKGPPSTARLKPHKQYLTKRIKEAAPGDVRASELFLEIREKGYRGTVRNVQRFVANLRKVTCSRDLHKPLD